MERGEWSVKRKTVEKVEKESEAEANGMHHVQHVQNICTKATIHNRMSTQWHYIDRHTLQLYHKET